MHYDIYLQVKRTGQTQAHIPDWPGCNWQAKNPEEAMDHAEGAIACHQDWLRKYGKFCRPASEPILPRLSQQHISTASEGYLIGFFETERQPVQAEEVPGFLDLMASARTELLLLVVDLPNETLIWQPAPKSWCIQDVLRHVAGAERWYLTRILDPTTIPRFMPCKSVWQRLENVRAVALERLSRLNEDERSAIISDGSSELWSARKVFRRYLEHEREHTFHIQEILSQYCQNLGSKQNPHW